MKFTVTLLAALLSTTLGSYVIKNSITDDYLFLDIKTRKSGTCNVFAAPRREIEAHPSRHMFFDITPVGDAYRIENTATKLALVDVPKSALVEFGYRVTAKMCNLKNKAGLWKTTLSPNEPDYITNKETGKYLYTNTMNLVDKYPRAMTATWTGLSLMGGCKWVIMKVDSTTFPGSRIKVPGPSNVGSVSSSSQKEADDEIELEEKHSFAKKAGKHVDSWKPIRYPNVGSLGGTGTADADLEDLDKVRESQNPIRNPKIDNSQTLGETESDDISSHKVPDKDTDDISSHKVPDKYTDDISSHKVPDKDTDDISSHKVPDKDTDDISSHKVPNEDTDDISSHKVPDKDVDDYSSHKVGETETGDADAKETHIEMESRKPEKNTNIVSGGIPEDTDEEEECGPDEVEVEVDCQMLGTDKSSVSSWILGHNADEVSFPGDTNGNEIGYGTTYVIQNDASREYLFVDTGTSGGGVADVFVGPRWYIEQKSTRNMYFTLTAVGGSYRIECADTHLSIIGFPKLSMMGEPVKAETCGVDNKLALWHMLVSPNQPSFIINEKTREYLYIYRMDSLKSYPRARTTRKSGHDLLGCSKWLIHKAPIRGRRSQ